MPLSYLALGDSYTIGESVPLLQNFPYQTTHLLRKQGLATLAPEIVATTGWTTSELITAVNQYTFLPHYDLVTLLIGVNNQYRGFTVEEYKKEFRQLLQKAILFATNKTTNVFVLSIPDYSVTPFAQGRNSEKIKREINAFNEAAKEICIQHLIAFLDITTGSKEASNNTQMIASDGLHPSGEEYKKWAKALAQAVMAGLAK